MENTDFNIKSGILEKYNGNEFHVVIPNSVTSIGDYAFYGCTGLTSIEISNSVTSIGRSAFYGCKGLTSIEIPNSVTKIGIAAFNGCTSLASINIPNSVMNICAWTFSECRSLTNLNIPFVMGIGYAAFENCYCMTNINLPNSVDKIGVYAFKGCTSLESIEIPNHVTIIDDFAFKDCTSLKNIKMPSSVTSIGERAFKGLPKVKSQYKQNGELRAFKAFHNDWTCTNDFHYEVGKTFHQDGEIKCCLNGFHACTNPLDVFNYYYGKLEELRFAEVELSGEMDFDDDDSKVSASDIRIVRELKVQELFDIYNEMEKEK